MLQLPRAPGLIDAKRLDKSSIKITFDPWTAEQPLDYLRLMRAKDDDPWQEVLTCWASSGSSWIDTSAGDDHDYRYVAMVIGDRRTSNSPLTQPVPSAPSLELRVSDVHGTVGVAIANYNNAAPDDPPPEGHFTLAGFIPNDFVSVNGSTASDPLTLNGPFTALRIDGDRIQYAEKIGSLPRGKEFSLDVLIKALVPLKFPAVTTTFDSCRYFLTPPITGSDGSGLTLEIKQGVLAV